MTGFAGYRQSSINLGLFISVSIAIHSWLLLSVASLNKTGFRASSQRELVVEFSTPAMAADKTRMQTISPDTSATRKTDTVRKIATKKQMIKHAEQKRHVSPETAEKTLDDKDEKKKPGRDTSVQKTNTTEKKQISNRENNLYLTEIVSKIEKNKYYPSAARRRSMEDDVNVTFFILENGSIKDIEINTRYKVLRTAAMAAIEEALPFNPPPGSVHSPFKIHYSMAFKIQ